jgi:diguanylate cyclase (GGDEF)-like protein/PAS domain S-box-containing protein
LSGIILHILLADDNKFSALPVIAFLQQEGYHVTHVHDGHAAVQAYRNTPPDLLLMDVVMPLMDGLEATRQIKALGGSRWIPIIMMTAPSVKEDIVAGLDAGADEYLVKPIDFDILAARLRSIKRIVVIQDNLNGILDNVHEAILTIDHLGTIQSFNMAAERIFGYSSADVIGNNVKMLMPSPYTEEHDGYLSRYLQERTPRVIGIGRKVQGRRKNGEVFPMRLAVTEIRRQGESHFVGLVSDISEEEAARERAEAVAKKIDEDARFIKALADSVPGMVSYWDKDLRCRFSNNAYMEWFGKAPEEVIGKTIMDLMGEQLYALNEPYIRAVLAGTPQKFERTLTKADGSIGHTWAHYIPDIDAHGAIEGFTVLVSDVTALKEAETELKLAASVYQNTIEGIMVTNDESTILSVNPAFTEITGYSAEEVVGQNPRILNSGKHDQAFFADMRQRLDSNGWWQGEIWNRHKDGGINLERMTITKIPDLSGKSFRYASVFHDITELWRKEEHVRHLAFHDALTDLPNRSLLMERLDRQIAMSAREPRGLAVMFLDLDRFKYVNDNLGHDIGDDLLKAVAQKLLAMVRHSDTVARFGGDEFVVLLDNPANENEIAEIANRIVATVNEPMEFRGKVAQVGTSIGIALYPTDGETSAQLIKSADTAMYAAKDSGKNTYRFFQATMTTHDN